MLQPSELWVLLRLLFPENLFYQYPGFQTPKLSPIYTIESAERGEKNRFVTLMMRDSKPIVEQLQAISEVAARFSTLQKRGFVPVPATGV
jgi:hypothetical protein